MPRDLTSIFTFIDELLAEAEATDKKLEREHIDLILLEIRDIYELKLHR